MNPDAIKDGGAAYPVAHQVDSIGLTIQDPEAGMSLRDHFAGLAMQAAAINPAGANGFTFSERAQWAYQQADAMIAAREAWP